MSFSVYEFNIVSLVFLFLLNIIYSLKQNYPTKKNLIFRSMLIVGLFANVLETASSYVNDYAAHTPVLLRYVLHLSFLVAFTGIVLELYVFIIEAVQRGVQSRYNQIVLASFLVCELLLICFSVFSDYIFYFDTDRKFHQGPGYILWYLIPVYVLIQVIITLCKNQAHHKDILTFSVYYMFVSFIAALFMVRLCPQYLFSTFDTAIFLFILSFTLENSEIYLDKFFDCYNNKAFIEKANQYIAAKKPYTALCFTIDQYSYVDQVLGQDAVNEMHKCVLHFLFKEFGRSNVYALYNIGYAMFTDSSQAQIDKMVDAIRNFFSTPIALGTRNEVLNPIFCIAQNPDFAKNGQHIIDEFNNTLHDMKSNKSNTVSYATGKYITLVQREQQVIYAMRKAIENNSFEVYYQPIFDLTSKHVKSLEALLRLNDD